MAKPLVLMTYSSILALSMACTGSGENTASDAGFVDARIQMPPDAAEHDAQPAALNCGDGPVPDPLVLAGQVKDLIGSSAATGVRLDVIPSGDSEPIVSATTDPNGEYSIDIPTDAEAWTGEIRATSDDYIDMHIYPSGLVEHFDSMNIPALTPDARMLAGIYAGVTIADDDALVIGFVFDCNQQGIEGATITTDLASGDLLYLLPGSPYIDADKTSTSTSGTAIVLNAVANDATPGKAKLSASYQDRNWEVEVDVIPGELAIAIFLP